MEFHKLIISPFDVEVEKTNLQTFLKEFIEMISTLEAMSTNTFKKIELKNIAKYSNLGSTVELILLAFPNYKIESEFSHVHYLLSKQRSI